MFPRASYGSTAWLNKEKVTATKPDDWSSIPGTPVVEGENQLPCIVVLWLPHIGTYVHICTCIHTEIDF